MRAQVSRADVSRWSACELPDHCHDLVGMTFNLHLVPRPGDSAIGGDEECASLGGHAQNFACAVGIDDGLVRIRDHRERELELIDEPLLYLGLVGRDAHDQGVQGLQLGAMRLEVLGFVGSTRGVGPGVEVHHHPLPVVL